MKDKLVALDLGASKVKLCVSELGYILSEPSFVVKDNDDLVFGKNAYQKMGEFCPYSSVFNNLNIKNAELVENYLNYLLDKCEIDGYIKNVIVATNNGCAVKQLANIEKCLIKCDAIKAKFVNGALCAYSMLDKDNSARIIIDIGASKTDITVVKKNKVVNGINLDIGCNDIDKQIMDFCSQNYSMNITPVMAENIRLNTATLDNMQNNTYSFFGVSVNGNKFAKNTISSVDIRDIIEDFYLTIISALETMLNVTDIDNIDEINNNGMDFIGGGSLITGLEKFFDNKLKLKCNTYKNATDIIALGLEKLV